MTRLYHISFLLLLCCFVVACSRNGSKLDELQTERQMVEDSIGHGNDIYALRYTERSMSAATDSTTYYLWLATRDKAFYSKMNADSMMLAQQRIAHYLQRHADDNDKAIDILRAEYALSKAVFYTAFLGRPDSGVVYNQRAADILRKYDDRRLQLLTAITNAADCYRQMGKLDYSADMYLQALALADSVHSNIKPRLEVELGISTAYSFMGDYDNSNQWWARVEAQVDSMIYDDKCIFYNNRGNDLYFQQRYAEAIPYFTKAIELTKGNPQMEWQYYTALYNLGEINVCLGNGTEARRLLDEADTFFRKVNFAIGRYYAVTSYIGLALLEHKPQEALNLIKSNPTPEHMIPLAVINRLQKEESTMIALGNYERAYDIHRQLDNIKDSVQTANMRMRMNTNVLRFRHDKQLAQQQHEIDHQRMVSIIAWAVCIVALLTVAILTVLVFLLRKQNQLRALAEQQRIIKLRMENARNRISPHFVYNALNHELLLQMKGKEVNIYTLTQLLRRGIAQANNLATTLKEEMDFVDYYVEIEAQQMGSDFSYSVEIQPDIDITKVWLPAMSVQIFVENAIKHGLRAMPPREGKQRMLKVRISKSSDNAIMIEVVDNGLGLGNNHSDSTKTGMRILSQTIQILNDKNKESINYGIENSCLLEQGHTGCRSWMTIPNGYDYTL